MLLKFLDLDFAFNDTCYTPRPCTATNQMEVQAELLYRGCCSRRFVPGNINYLGDVVVIIRGGGAQHELASFDNYDIALAIAKFPLPVIAGIGHERDETIVDRVAYLKVKTPTAAVTFLIESFVEMEGFLHACAEHVNDVCRETLADHIQKHSNTSMSFHQISPKLSQNIHPN